MLGMGIRGPRRFPARLEKLEPSQQLALFVRQNPARGVKWRFLNNYRA